MSRNVYTQSDNEDIQILQSERKKFIDLQRDLAQIVRSLGQAMNKTRNYIQQAEYATGEWEDIYDWIESGLQDVYEATSYITGSLREIDTEIRSLR